MNALLLIRRLHLFFGMFFIPWVIVFALSSLPINHTGWGRPVTWTVVQERDYDRAVPAGADLKEIGRQVLADVGLTGGFSVNRPGPARLIVNRPQFLDVERVTYDIERRRLVVERRSNHWLQVVVSMHTRAGYYLGSPGNVFWAVMVDALCVGLVFWILTGLIMWWQLKGSRRLGWLAIASGLACFAVLVWRL